VDYAIRAYESIGPIRFGMSVRDARAALAEPLGAIGKGWALARSFLKDPRRDVLPTDDFFDVGFHIYYCIRGERMVVDAVEAFDPAPVTLDGFPLFSRPYGAIRELLRSLDRDLKVEADGATSMKLGVSLYDPTCGEATEAPLASVFVFSEGYWDRPLPPLRAESL
jgi:hypothetical protein